LAAYIVIGWLFSAHIEMISAFLTGWGAGHESRAETGLLSGQLDPEDLRAVAQPFNRRPVLNRILGDAERPQGVAGRVTRHRCLSFTASAIPSSFIFHSGTKPRSSHCLAA
jgi:hypothetical protein